VHLSIDANMSVHAISVTGTGVSDSDGMDAVRRAGVALECVLADGAYCSIERTQVLSVLACRPVIPAGERSRAWWQQDSVA
jgi:hypothetical protein